MRGTAGEAVPAKCSMFKIEGFSTDGRDPLLGKRGGDPLSFRPDK
jgi:hypothetical protein